MTAIPIHIRRMTSSDLPMVLDAWVDDFRHQSRVRFVPNDIYYAHQRKLILLLLRRSITLIAADPENTQAHNYGFICAEPNKSIIHFIYTKGPFRGLGIATELFQALVPLDHGPIYCTHPTKCVFTNQAQVSKHQLIANPFLLPEVSHAQS